MNLPEEAVEAAARAAYIEHSQEPGFDAEAAWNDMSGAEDWEQGLWGLVARAALEAAAPFIAAQAWDRGSRAAAGRPNPYRSGT